MKLKKKSVVAVLTLSMSMGSVLSMVPVFAETSQQNLALNKTAYVSAEYGTMPRKNLTDGNEKTHLPTESHKTAQFFRFSVSFGKSALKTGGSIVFLHKRCAQGVSPQNRPFAGR